MRALVTGATGFVGGLLAARLRERGDTVVALVRDPRRATDLANMGVELVTGDLADQAALTTAIRGVEIVYHVAGAIAAPDEAGFMTVNRDGTASVVEAAERAGVSRLLLVSSLAASGPSAPDRPHRDPAVAAPVTQYGRSKLAAEQVVEKAAVDWTIVRPPAVYGPRDRELLRIFKAVAKFGIAPVFGRGLQQLSLIYGPDLADALIAAATSPGTRKRRYYAAHPEVHTFRSMVTSIAQAANRAERILPIPIAVGRAVLVVTETVARFTGRTTILTTDKGNELFQPAWTCDPSSLTEATGWAPTVALSEGAGATLEWYRRAGWL